jgi:hypothetical protein
MCLGRSSLMLSRGNIVDETCAPQFTLASPIHLVQVQRMNFSKWDDMVASFGKDEKERYALCGAPSPG